MIKTMRMYIIKHILIAAIYLLIPISLSYAQELITREQALYSGVKNNPLYKSASETSSKYFFNYLGSYSDYLPQVNLSFNAVNSRDSGILTTDESYRASLNLNVFKGFTGYAAVRQAGLLHTKYTKAEYNTLLELIKDINVAYQDVIRTSYMKKTASSSYESAELLLNEAKQRQALDIITKAELYSAMADKEKAYADLLDAQMNYSAAVLELKRLSCMDIDESDVFETSDISFELRTIDEYIQAALGHNLELQQMELSKDISKYGYRYSYGNFLPAVDIGASTSWDETDQKNNNSISLTASWNIFSGMNNIMDTLMKAKDYNISQYELLNSREIVLKEVNVLYIRAQSAEERLKSAELYVMSAQENYNAMLEMFRIGRVSLRDAVDARATLLDAQSTFADAQYLKVQTYEELAVITGGYYENGKIQELIR